MGARGVLLSFGATAVLMLLGACAADHSATAPLPVVATGGGLANLVDPQTREPLDLDHDRKGDAAILDVKIDLAAPSRARPPVESYWEVGASGATPLLIMGRRVVSARFPVTSGFERGGRVIVSGSSALVKAEASGPWTTVNGVHTTATITPGEAGTGAIEFVARPSAFTPAVYSFTGVLASGQIR